MPPATRHISYEELHPLFHLPMREVCDKLGVCATVLKRLCRQYGIARWPHRKLKSMEKKIETLEAVLVRNPRNFEIRHEIQQLKEAMDYLIARKPSLDGPSDGEDDMDAFSVTDMTAPASPSDVTMPASTAAPTHGSVSPVHYHGGFRYQPYHKKPHTPSSPPSSPPSSSSPASSPLLAPVPPPASSSTAAAAATAFYHPQPAQYPALAHHHLHHHHHHHHAAHRPMQPLPHQPQYPAAKSSPANSDALSFLSDAAERVSRHEVKRERSGSELHLPELVHLDSGLAPTKPPALEPKMDHLMRRGGDFVLPSFGVHVPIPTRPAHAKDLSVVRS